MYRWSNFASGIFAVIWISHTTHLNNGFVNQSVFPQVQQSAPEKVHTFFKKKMKGAGYIFRDIVCVSGSLSGSVLISHERYSLKKKSPFTFAVAAFMHCSDVQFQKQVSWFYEQFLKKHIGKWDAHALSRLPTPSVGLV